MLVVVVVVIVVVVAVLLARLVVGKIGSDVVPFCIGQSVAVTSTNKNCLNYLIIPAGILNCSIKI